MTRTRFLITTAVVCHLLLAPSLVTSQLLSSGRSPDHYVVCFDGNLGFLQYSAMPAAYNWDGGGLSLEYRRLAWGSLCNQNQFRFRFALANIGALGKLRRQERWF